ncbi:hypothetical protein MC885_018666, partial [Smutsia gigantea]
MPGSCVLSHVDRWEEDLGALRGAGRRPIEWGVSSLEWALADTAKPRNRLWLLPDIGLAMGWDPSGPTSALCSEGHPFPRAKTLPEGW